MAKPSLFTYKSTSASWSVANSWEREIMLSMPVSTDSYRALASPNYSAAPTSGRNVTLGV
jgi:hypothetical protein